jgi:hypothetical protein
MAARGAEHTEEQSRVVLVAVILDIPLLMSKVMQLLLCITAKSNERRF